MYFPTYDGYTDTNDIEKTSYNDDNVCFICLESATFITLKMIMPNNDCSCDVVCHEECLKTWLKMNQTCPICRIHLKWIDEDEDEDDQDDYNHIYNSIHIHVFFNNNNLYFSIFIWSLRVFRILFLLFYIWFLCKLLSFSYLYLDLTPSGVVKRGY